ncbi:alpha/beta hydrolase [Granulosicoccaceae sp. 1_MG-2023]|nr:alpha/beta hydrolase [Granulosicoccaceae sp. 1_MG-2023]
MHLRPYLLVSAVLAAPAVSAADFDDFSDLFSNEACAGVVGVLSADMPAEPLYQLGDGQCRALSAAAIDSTLAVYSDTGCSRQISFETPDTAAFCAEIADKNSFGNDPSADTATPVWRLPPWPALDAGVLSISGNSRPYQARRIYRRAGACALEIHVFKKAIDADGLKPLLLIHGGSWKYRQTGAIGLFTQISHYTEAGFAVFTPFYRLTGEGEAAAACSSAGGDEIVADIEAAYQWLLGNAAGFGADATAVYVAGQSAGAHLAARMAVDHPDTTAAALLLYPPTDFGHFIRAYQAGEVDSAQGTDALADFLGESLATADPDSDIVRSNSLPERVAASPDSFPPMYLIHGGADELVPVEQSTRLCNAYGGDPASGAQADNSDAAAERQSFDCGGQSRLDVVKSAGHVLDFCVTLNPPWSLLIDTSGLCPAGDADSQLAARSSLSAALDWLQNVDGAGTAQDIPAADVSDSATTDDGGSGSGGGATLLGALLLAGFAVRKAR